MTVDFEALDLREVNTADAYLDDAFRRRITACRGQTPLDLS
jgi:hypothetical protein